MRKNVWNFIKRSTVALLMLNSQQIPTSSDLQPLFPLKTKPSRGHFSSLSQNQTSLQSWTAHIFPKLYWTQVSVTGDKATANSYSMSELRLAAANRFLGFSLHRVNSSSVFRWTGGQIFENCTGWKWRAVALTPSWTPIRILLSDD